MEMNMAVFNEISNSGDFYFTFSYLYQMILKILFLVIFLSAIIYQFVHMTHNAPKAPNKFKNIFME